MKRILSNPMAQALIGVVVILTLLAFGLHEAAAGVAVFGGATTYSDVYTGLTPRRNTPDSACEHTLVVPFWIGTTSGTVAPVVNDILALCKVPEGVQIADWRVQSEDADSNGTPTLEFTLGSLNAGKTDISTTYGATIAVGETGGVVRATTTAAFAEASTAERVIGIKWTTAAATFATGKKGLLVLSLIG